MFVILTDNLLICALSFAHWQPSLCLHALIEFESKRWMSSEMCRPNKKEVQLPWVNFQTHSSNQGAQRSQVSGNLISPLPWADFGSMIHRFSLYRDRKDCFLIFFIYVFILWACRGCGRVTDGDGKEEKTALSFFTNANGLNYRNTLCKVTCIDVYRALCVCVSVLLGV